MTAPGFTRKGQATRGRIVDATAELMFEHGVESTTMERVREAADVSGSQLSHYFRGKIDLTREVVAMRRRNLTQFHNQPDLGALDTIDGIRAWARACIADIDTVYRRGGCVYGSLVGELIDGEPEVRDDLAAGHDEWIGLFRAGLAAMKKRGELRADADPRHLAVSLVVAHQGGAMLTFVTGDPESFRANITAAVEYVESFLADDAGR
ncbi:TetR/AcrR family transcriptional regulator [Mycobacterium sp. PS03-16]|uniref:TetR/AcrR family transcriptional regulator n=1 Tax=Mycobacterium sp. PS03-16 TaxID=2559611 RepID=UPI001073881D|nr:TetR/AcrR family transcriptional regulator [Mycobacterium sp. PS03-16]TFV61555.1 TetR/AcrR family transcriptional regulator [Mycobacterium sp. PS03-16]